MASKSRAKLIEEVHDYLYLTSWDSSCACVEVGGFSGLITQYAPDILAEAMTFYPATKEVGGNYGKYNRCHLSAAVGKYCYDDEEYKAMDEFVEALKEYGWTVIDGGGAPHGSYDMYIFVHTPPSDKVLAQWTRFGLSPEQIAKEKARYAGTTGNTKRVLPRKAQK